MTPADQREVALRAADDWAHAHGVELTHNVTPVAGSSTTPGSAFTGVAFDVHVGHGDLSLDQRMPGVLDSWRWSGRFEHWARVLNRLDGRQGRHLAEVVPLRPGGQRYAIGGPLGEALEDAMVDYERREDERINDLVADEVHQMHRERRSPFSEPYVGPDDDNDQ